MKVIIIGGATAGMTTASKLKRNLKDKVEIVAYSGDGRSCYLRALKLAKQGNFEKAEQKIAEGEAAINAAHQRQTDLLQDEAQGNYSDVTMIMVHGQDHLMTTALLRDLINNLLDIYREKKEG